MERNRQDDVHGRIQSGVIGRASHTPFTKLRIVNHVQCKIDVDKVLALTNLHLVGI